jgi:hypothetical protein
LFAAGVHQAEVARQLQVLAPAVSVWQPVTVTAQDSTSRTPVAGEVLFDGSVVGPTNTPSPSSLSGARVRVRDPDNGIGWDMIETTASVPTAF